MIRLTPSPKIWIELQDGSGCYITVVPVRSFRAHDVACAIGEAAGLMIVNFAKEEEKRGSTWDPDEYVREWRRGRNGL